MTLDESWALIFQTYHTNPCEFTIDEWCAALENLNVTNTNFEMTTEDKAKENIKKSKL